MEMPTCDLLVTGDYGLEYYVYIEELPDKPANLREAWVDAREFRTIPMPGGAGQLARCLGCSYVPHEQAAAPKDAPESLYLLTNQARKGQIGKRWKVALAIVAGQRDRPCPPVCLEDFPAGRAVAVMDFCQGWLTANHQLLPQLLADRSYLIRTHDPVYPCPPGGAVPEDIWRQVRRASPGRGIWFSPYQDMADGALRVAGNWDTVRSNIVGHLKGDDSLWDEAAQTWLEHIVIQIDYDGALVISPGLKDGEETIIAFPGDQPGSFSKQGEGTVIGGGIVLAASLAELLAQDQFTPDDLVTKTGEGLTRARELVRQGYEENPDPEKDTMYPQAVLHLSAAQEQPTRYAPRPTTRCRQR